MKKFVVVFVLITLIMGNMLQFAWTAPSVSGRAAVLIDAKSGKVLYDYNMNQSLPPASTTKIMTAILALEKAKLDDVVKVGVNPPLVEGTRVYLVEGEEVTLRELLYAMMVHSANDAALAIAEHIAGSKEEFAKMMNEKAKEIGCQNTSFVNPHGLSEEGHVASAHDLALMGQYAMKDEVFREVVITKVLDWEGQDWQTRLININNLLWRQEGATGIKTGYTTEAKQTIVASATKGNQDLIAVVLGSSGSNLWTDAQGLLDYGFKNYDSMTLASPEHVSATIKIFDDSLELVPANKVDATLNKNGADKIDQRLELFSLEGKINKGDVVGELSFLVDGEQVARVNLLANNDVSPKIDWVKAFVSAFAGIYLLQILLRVFRIWNKKRRNSLSFGNDRRSYRF